MHKVVAIVGRPNVGKSTLFNRIIGKKIAIVHHKSGVTRDRNYGEVEWNGKKFFLIDTGGFVPDSDEAFNRQIREQIKLAVNEADKIIFIVDGIAGLHPVDSEIVKVLRKNAGNKEIYLVVNKIDSENRDINTMDFFRLGLDEPYAVSAINGRNIADLLDKITHNINKDTDDEEESDTRPKFAIIGRPNSGKSSLVNALIKENRHIVSEIPGTTRDSIDSVLKYFKQEIVLIDTAGLIKKSKLRDAESLEFYSTVRTYRSIDRCDVVMLIVDSTILYQSTVKTPDLALSRMRLDKQDIKIIEDVATKRKGILVIFNKWDLIDRDSKTSELIIKKINEHLRSYEYLKFIFISALTKQRIHKVLKEAMKIYNERKKQIKTSELNEKILKRIMETPHPSVKGREIKINYITQIKTAPPVFAFFTNEPKLVTENYKRFLEKKIREFFGFTGVPVGMIFKKKN
ncbi:MAG: ribosome biogenesis GTPase Der [Ignavibacteria bacterium]|nr:ribosome biogenesis GTPase Der [Ignavibacteria bacterium]